ncbi:MAG: hypothetical protein IJA60_01765 [Clostridia bacterium]|nr:hypothetical protein [Clostridia bacterium]
MGIFFNNWTEINKVQIDFAVKFIEIAYKWALEIKEHDLFTLSYISMREFNDPSEFGTGYSIKIFGVYCECSDDWITDTLGISPTITRDDITDGDISITVNNENGGIKGPWHKFVKDVYKEIARKHPEWSLYHSPYLLQISLLCL